MNGSRQDLNIGMTAAWATVVLFTVYAITLFAGGVVKGLPREPYFAIAEVLTMVGSIIIVILVAAIHLCTPAHLKIFSLLGLGWAFVTSGITIIVHISKLTVERQLDHESKISFARLFDFEWPSLLFAIEFASWHIGFGLSVLFTAFAFQGSGKERVIRLGLMAVGLLCLIGILGPATGYMYLRLIGVFGYGILFPIICIWNALLFRHLIYAKQKLN